VVQLFETMPTHWYALMVKSQHEKAIGRHLDAIELESFVPLYRTRRQWSDRTKELDLPLFSNYVFARFSWRTRGRVCSIPGVRGVVAASNLPLPVPDPEIDALKHAVGAGLPLRPWPFLKAGQRVLITRGPLRGVEGVLIRHEKNWQLVLNIEMLQRSVAVRIDRAFAEPICPLRPEN
jgi:transcription antitermination factor NusG